jgi:hypothetical protein
VIAPDPYGAGVQSLTQGQGTIIPSGTVVSEMTVSQCPGVIDPGAGPCYASTTFVNKFGIALYTSPIWNAPGRCMATAPGQWYVNVRWTYPTCSFGGGCGFTMQWAAGS